MSNVFEEYEIKSKGNKKKLVFVPTKNSVVFCRRVYRGLLFWVMNSDGGASFQEIPLVCEGWEFYMVLSGINKDFFSCRRTVTLNLEIRLEDREFDPYDLVKDIPEGGFIVVNLSGYLILIIYGKRGTR